MTTQVYPRCDPTPTRYTVEYIIAYGQRSFRIVDHGGERPYIMARCDSRDNAIRICRLLEATP